VSVVAALTRRSGDLDVAEEAAAEAFATAVARWPVDGVPPNLGAWLTTTANRKAIDRIRRENKRDDKQKEAQMVYDDDPPEPLGAIDDERLRLIFTCCHPALAMETRVALTLRMVRPCPRSPVPSWCRRPPWGSGSPERRPRSRRPASLIGCRPRRISQSASPAYSP
jgi:predicted RNA polymerase sigma factor